MRPTFELLRHEHAARRFFAALAQSSLGTGAGYAALLLLAYDRLHSPLAISLVLAADLVPAMLLGPVLGAAADRWARRRCAVAGDVLRGVAFLGLAVVPGIGGTLALALVAGTGTALFTPAALAGLPSLVERPRLPAANSLFAAVTDLGWALGPALAAAVLLVTGPELLMVLNGATFALSAVVISRLPFGDPPAAAASRTQSLLEDVRQGLRASARLPGVPTVLAASGGVLLFAGMFNVAELPYATEVLGAGAAGFSALLAVFAIGVVGGSLAGARGGGGRGLRRRYLGGLWLVAAGFLAASTAPSLAAAALVFGLAGGGNGLVVVHERLLIQERAPDPVLGRVFGVRDALGAWAMAVALVAGAPAVTLLGARGTVLAAGGGTLLVAVLAGLALARRDPLTSSPQLGVG